MKITIQDVDEVVSLVEQICRNLALYHLLTSGCSVVNGCRQNDSPIKTSQQSITNPQESSPSINVLWSEMVCL